MNHITESKSLILNILNLLDDGEFDTAKKIFNEEVFGKYNEVTSEDDKLFQLKMFLSELDDYLNDPSVRAVNATSVEELKRSFNEVFKEF